MRIISGRFQVNCWVVTCPKTKKTAIIDPTDDISAIWEKVSGLDVEYLLHTHAHLDHFGQTKELKKRFQAVGKTPKVLLHALDKPLWMELRSQGAMFGLDYEPPCDLDAYLSDGQKIPLGDLELEVIHTPGHSPGGVCFYGDGKLYSGDTLFSGSIGRTDLWEGSHEKLLTSIKSRLFVLPPETVVYPGHGPETTIGAEKATNPFLT